MATDIASDIENIRMKLKLYYYFIQILFSFKNKTEE